MRVGQSIVFLTVAAVPPNELVNSIVQCLTRGASNATHGCIDDKGKLIANESSTHQLSLTHLDHSVALVSRGAGRCSKCHGVLKVE